MLEPPATDTRYVLVQTSAPDYRRPVISELARRLGNEFHLLVGAEAFHHTIATDPSIVQGYGTIENRYVVRRRLVWQKVPIGFVLKAPVVIAELNPRVLSNWLILAVRKVLCRPTVLWGHAWSTRGPNARSEHLRHLQRRLASVIVVYTNTQRVALTDKMPHHKIIAAPNALYPSADMHPARRLSPPSDIVYVGRLIPEKKPLLLLRAYLLALDDMPHDIQLVFVGTGSELPGLRRAARPAEERIRFLGHINDPRRLREVYAGAIASVSPGYVGLSITQSLGFGVPMVIADNEPHSPEIEAAWPGVNARFFRADDPAALARALVDMVRERETWMDRRTMISAWARREYSVEVMVAGLLRAIAAAESSCGPRRKRCA